MEEATVREKLAAIIRLARAESAMRHGLTPESAALAIADALLQHKDVLREAADGRP